MRKCLFFCCVLLPALSAAGQQPADKIVYVVDSVVVKDDPEEGNEVVENDIADLRVITNKDSLNMLGFGNMDRAIYLFTKEYRNRPDDIKRIPSPGQLERKKEGVFFNGNPYTGKCINYYYSGKKQSEIVFQNGQPNGLTTMYYPDGHVFMETVYTNGITNGQEKKYYEDGTLLSRGLFINGREDGAWETYYPNGQVKQRNSFKAGVMEGEATVYYSSGKILALEPVKDGKPTPDQRLEKVYKALNKGHAGMKEEDFQAAAKQYSKAIELDTTYAESWFSRGRALFNDMRFDEAIRDFDKALQLEPYMGEALAERAFARIRKYQFAGSRQLSKHSGVTVMASKAKPDIPPGELSLICSDLKQGIFLGRKNKMILKAVTEYCGGK